MLRLERGIKGVRVGFYDGELDINDEEWFGFQEDLIISSMILCRLLSISFMPLGVKE